MMQFKDIKSAKFENDKNTCKSILEDVYSDELQTMNGPVGLFQPYYSHLKAIEAHSYNLGYEDIESNLKKLLEQYPKEKYFCSYYTIDYTISKKIIELFYKGESRIPIRDITDYDLIDHGDVLFRASFVEKSEYFNISNTNRRDYFLPATITSVGPNNLKEVPFTVAQNGFLFYRYKCDKYLMTVPPAEADLVIKDTYVRLDIDEDVSQRKRNIKQVLGEYFVEWIHEGRVSLLPQQHNDGLCFVMYVDKEVPHIAYDYDKKDKEEFKKQIFKTEEEYNDALSKIRKTKSLAYYPSELLKTEYRDCPIYDFWDYQIKCSKDTNMKKVVDQEIFDKLREIIKDDKEQEFKKVEDSELVETINQ